MSNTYPCYKLSRRIVDNHIPLDNLRLETSPTRSCVVPYHHLEFATLESTQNEEVITLLFLNRTVRIIGRNLRALGEALQERTVEPSTPCRNGMHRWRMARPGSRSSKSMIKKSKAK